MPAGTPPLSENSAGSILDPFCIARLRHVCEKLTFVAVLLSEPVTALNSLMDRVCAGVFGILEGARSRRIGMEVTVKGRKTRRKTCRSRTRLRSSKRDLAFAGGIKGSCIIAGGSDAGTLAERQAS